MAINYERVKWQNAPETATPIDAGNLNHMDNGIVAIARELDTELPLMQEQVDAIPTTVDEKIEERFGETISQEVDAWLDEHVTPGGSTIVVDSTLSISGAAADAKVTGDALATKASQSDVDAIEEALVTKADLFDVEAIEQTLLTKADSSDVETLEENLNADITQLKEDLSESVGDLKSAFNGSFVDGKYEISKTLPQNETVSVSYEQGTNKGGGYYNTAGEILYPTGVHKHFDAIVNGADRVYISALQDAGAKFGVIKYDGTIVETFSYHQGEAYSIALDITKEYQICVNAFDGLNVKLMIHYPESLATKTDIAITEGKISDVANCIDNLFNTFKFDGYYLSASDATITINGLFDFDIETSGAFRGAIFKLDVLPYTNYSFYFDVTITTGNCFLDILNSDKTVQLKASTLFASSVWSGIVNTGGNRTIFVRFSSSRTANSKFSISNSQILQIVKKNNYKTCVKKPYDFTGKTLYFFGDSITYGYIAASGDVPAHQATNQYPKEFAQALNANYTNYGVSGSYFAGENSYSIPEKIESTELGNADAIFVAGGVNDWQIGITESDLATALESLCSYLNQNYNGEVIFITPINEAGFSAQNAVQSLENVRNVITRIALKYEYSVVQGWEFPFPNEDDDATFISTMFQDRLHPTEAGYSLYAKSLRSALF